ncbi:MAG: hypothetical protein IKF29_07115 [Oceanobacillus sp.]|nr:hypothetical protein [Oceanobacillus sp.]
MSKSIVVINTPKNCEQCPFRESPWSFCLGEYEKEKHCPLKPVPEIKNLRDYRDKIVGDYKLQIRISDFISGYNSCIDEILGEEE